MPWQKIKRGLKKDDSLGDGGLTWITNILKKLRQDLLFSRQSAPPFDVALTNYYVFFSSQKPKSVTAASSVTLINPGNITLRYRL